MCIFIKRTVFVLLLFVTTNYWSNGHKTGAPPFSCTTMTPGHGASVQTSSPPYNISVVNPETNGDIFRVRLYSISPSLYFTGFLLRPKLQYTDTSGTFIEVPNDCSFLDCGSEKSSAVTHNSNIKRRAIEVDWQTPSGYEGNVQFVGTFVYNYSTFWTGIESLPIQIGKRSSRAPYVNQQINVALLSMYNGCGTSKNCLPFPDNNCLKTKSCDGLVSIVGTTGTYQVEMFAKNSMYVAVGFSDDNLMGGDNVAECVTEGNAVRSYRSWNEPNRKSNQRLDDNSGIILVNGLYTDGTIYCKLKIDPVTYALDRKFDLNNNEYFLLLAAGKELKENGVGFHDSFFTSSRIRRFLSEVGGHEASQDSYYDGCDSIKTCFGVPDGCVERQNCVAATSVTVQGNRYIFTMLAKNAAYVATGVSDDKLMGSDNVVECVNNGTIVEAYKSWNLPNRKDNTRRGVLGTELLNGAIIDNVLQCTVAYESPPNMNFNSDDKYYLLLAAGTSLNPDRVGFHNLVFKASDQRVSLASPKQSESFYDGCERTKTCFGAPNDCINSQNCQIALAMSTDYENRYTFHMFAINAAYVAVGLSDDEYMGDDAVFECVREEQNGNVIKPFMSWNVPGQKANNRVKQNNLSLLNSSYTDGKLQCAVLLQNPVFTLERKTFNLITDKYVILLAAGSTATPSGPSSLGRVGYHDIIRTAAAEKRSLADVSALRGASKLFLHLHGSFMIAAWIGLASLGIVLARYYKQTWVESSVCGKDVWFAWHRLFMFLTWILTIAGLVLIYLYVNGIVTGPAQTHALLGLITTILTFFQPIGALFRPHPDSSHRPIFNWLHWLIGNSAHIVAIVTIFLAVDLSKAELPKWTDWILVAFVAFYVAIHLLLSIVGCLSDKSGGMRVNTIQMKDMNVSRNMPHQYERRKNAAYSGLRKCLFTIHFLVIMGFSIFLILLVVYAPAI